MLYEERCPQHGVCETRIRSQQSQDHTKRNLLRTYKHQSRRGHFPGREEKNVHKARQKWARVIWKAPAFKTTRLSTVNQEMICVCGLHFTLGWLSTLSCRAWESTRAIMGVITKMSLQLHSYSFGVRSHSAGLAQKANASSP